MRSLTPTPRRDEVRSVRLTGEQLERLREIAAANGRTVSQELRFAAARHIEAMDRAAGREAA